MPNAEGKTWGNRLRDSIFLVRHWVFDDGEIMPQGKAKLENGSGGEPLTPETYSKALDFLSHRDGDLAEVISKFGPPPLWNREPGFATLVLIILEQQVSLASARAVFQRLTAAVSPFTAKRFLKVGEAKLLGAGITRQKLSYCRHLAESIAVQRFDLDAIDSFADQEARAALMAIRGVGPWSADIYLLRALGRPDVWPRGDLALAVSLQEIKGFGNRPTADEAETVSLQWRPWRAVAARILWHYYLAIRS
jgi:DNA-3-methyladenine glycosylase II